MKFAFISVYLVITYMAFGQDSSMAFRVKKVSVGATSSMNEERVFQVVEQMPEYPGGELSLYNFIQNHMIYPDSLRLKHIEGRVVVGFVIDTNGAINNITIQKMVHPLLDEEAIRLVSLLGKFKPGRQKGNPVRVQYMLPINFGTAKSIEEEKQRRLQLIRLLH